MNTTDTTPRNVLAVANAMLLETPTNTAFQVELIAFIKWANADIAYTPPECMSGWWERLALIVNKHVSELTKEWEFKVISIFTAKTIKQLSDEQAAKSPKKVYKPGDVIEIKVGGRPFTTIIDEHGVQRFKPNRTVMLLIEGASAVYDNTHMCGKSLPPGFFGWGELENAFISNQFSVDEYLAFITMTGYRVSDIVNIQHFKHLAIENPVWDK